LALTIPVLSQAVMIPYLSMEELQLPKGNKNGRAYGNSESELVQFQLTVPARFTK